MLPVDGHYFKGSDNGANTSKRVTILNLRHEDVVFATRRIKHSGYRLL
jgi:hypothetical protein